MDRKYNVSLHFPVYIRHSLQEHVKGLKPISLSGSKNVHIVVKIARDESSS